MQYPEDKIIIRTWKTSKSMHMRVVDTLSQEEASITHIHYGKQGWVGHHSHGAQQFVLTPWQAELYALGIFYYWR